MYQRILCLLTIAFLGSVFSASVDVYAQVDCRNRTLEDTIPALAYQVRGSITAQNSTVSSGTDVQFNAGERVVLGPGFRVQAGGTFKASVTAALKTSTTPLPPLANLPANTSNSRFYTDRFPVKHPSLSLNGFNCGTECGKGWGLKQALEKIYSQTPDGSLSGVFSDVRFYARQPYNHTQFNYGEVVANSVRLQSRALVALVSYVLYQNGFDPQTIDAALPCPGPALDSLRSALLNTPSWALQDEYEGDAVKWATPVGNVARALDFYLALENAFQKYEPAEYVDEQSTRLLSKAEKKRLLNEYVFYLDNFEHHGGEHGGAFGVDGYDAQPGNWPLKVQTALGYATMLWQNGTDPSCPNVDPTSVDGLPGQGYIDGSCPPDGWLARAFKAAGRPLEGTTDRYRYWAYETDDGKIGWAEGPYYFEILGESVVPFWHAARINGLHSNASIVGFSLDGDPFFKPWFTAPYHWLADLTTPEGATPPLDDGNKWLMGTSSILAWSGDYGDAALGEKFAWINGRPGLGPAYKTDLLPVTLAVPRAQTVRAPLETLTSTTGVPRNEVVARRTHGGLDHYVLLNGEHGASIIRGESHEQPDQMQLLYYVDDTSYLMDSGYDKVDFPKFSWWNSYWNHNVMIMPNAYENGVKGPYWSGEGFRAHSDHQDVDYLRHARHGNVDLLEAAIPFLWSDKSEMGQYYRAVFFVNDPASPYLIDLNAAHTDDFPSEFPMRYHLNTIDVETAVDPGTATNYYVARHLRSNDVQVTTQNHLVIHPFSVERIQANYVSFSNDDASEPNLGGGAVPIRRLNIVATDERDAFTTVAFMQAVPNTPADQITSKLTPFPRPYHSTTTQDLNSQAWTWPIDANTIDVFAARSAVAKVDASARGNQAFVITEAANFPIRLPGTADYGFARLRQVNGAWAFDPDYQINLIEDRLDARISGPYCAEPGYTTTFYASVGGGYAPHSYKWQQRIGTTTYAASTTADPTSEPSAETASTGESVAMAPEPGDWSNAGTGSSVGIGLTSPTSTESYDLRLIVTDSRGNVDTSAVHSVTVQSSCVPPESQALTADSTGSVRAAMKAAPAPLPTAYALHPAYPNPARGRTTIPYDLPEAAPVTLAVYDLLGREVARLVDGPEEPGFRRAVWDGSGLPSGLYVYRLTAGSFTATRTLVLVR